MQASVIARGMEEASTPRILGAWCASALVGATALGLAIAAAGQRAANWKPMAALLGGVTALPLLGAATWLIASEGYGAVALVVLTAALGASATLMVAFGAAAGDVPHGRAAALAAAAGPAAVLAVLAAVTASETAALASIFSAIAHAPPASRGAFLALGVEEVFGPGATVRWVTAGAGTLACLGLAAYAASRARPSVGRLVGGAALGLAVLLPLGVDRIVDALGASDGAALGGGAFDAAPGFEPLTIDTGEPKSDADAFVLPDGVRLRDGTLVSADELATVAGRARVGAALLTRSTEHAVALSPSVTDMRPPWGAEDAPFTDEVRRGLAIDRRAPGRLIAWTVGAAEQAGVTSLELLGTTRGPTEEQRALIARHVPLMLRALSTTGCVTVYLTPAFPGAPAARDRTLLHGTVGAAPRVTLATRPGASEPGRTLDGTSALENAAGEYEAPYERVFATRRAWLAIGADATPDALVRVALAASREALRPVLVSGPIPGHPDRALGPEGPDDDLLRGGTPAVGDVMRPDGSPATEATQQPTGASEASDLGPRGDAPQPVGGTATRGSLSEEEIRSVVQRAHPRIRACYEQRRGVRPDLAVRVSVRLVIGPRGEVQSAHPNDDETGDPALGACVAAVFRALRFPKPAGGGVVTVTYPLVFLGE
jgi:hypothetical protein